MSEQGPMEDRAVAMVMQAIPGEVTVPDARRILDSVRVFAREQDAHLRQVMAALEGLAEYYNVLGGDEADWCDQTTQAAWRSPLAALAAVREAGDRAIDNPA